MQWAGVGMWMVLGLSACSPTKTEIGNLNVIPQPQEVSQDIQAHPFVINPQTFQTAFLPPVQSFP